MIGSVQGKDSEPREIEECVRYYPPDLRPVAEPSAVVRGAPAGHAARAIDLFVSIPFCMELCGFCPFNVYPAAGFDLRLYLDALSQEIDILNALHDFSRTRIRTVWVGGGTPMLLSDGDLARLFTILATAFDLGGAEEITVEARPSSQLLTPFRTGLLRDHGVNRISIGVQSLDARFLEPLRRQGTERHSLATIRTIQDAGFGLNVDMMYRLPGQTLEDVLAELDQVGALGIQHLSWFPYVPHEGTQLAAKMHGGSVGPQADRESYLWMFQAVEARMGAAGYRQYTPYYFTRDERCTYHVDRWCLPQLETLGIGAGAFSFFNGWIYANQHRIGDYQTAVASGAPPVLAGKRLDEDERITRLAVLGIKFLELSGAAFERASGVALEVRYPEELARLTASGLAEWDGRVLRCTQLGRGFNNDVAIQLSTASARRIKHPQGIDFRRSPR